MRRARRGLATFTAAAAVALTLPSAGMAAPTATPTPTATTPTARAPDPFYGLRFLLGEWTAGAGGGAPGEAVAGGFTLGLELDGRVAIRRSFSDYAPRTGEAKGVHHEDLTVIHPTPDGLRATYWDNEGHLIEYAVTTAPGRAVFESVGGGLGPRFRLTYQEQGPGKVAIEFAIAPPGGAFKVYVQGTATRR